MLGLQGYRRAGTRAILGLGVLTLATLPVHQGSATAVASPVTATVNLVLDGPNQWTTSPTSFGTPWDAQVQRFEAANPGVTLKTNVLPLTSFFQTESTLIQAGSGTDLMFNQMTYKPEQVVSLMPWLNKPNPYAPASSKYKTWLGLVPLALPGHGAKGRQRQLRLGAL